MSQRYNGYLPPRAKGLNQGDGAAGCLLLAIVLLVFLPIVVILSGLLTLLAWNVGVVAIVAACGGAVAKIGLGTAICANIALGIVGRIFRGPSKGASDS